MTKRALPPSFKSMMPSSQPGDDAARTDRNGDGLTALHGAVKDGTVGEHTGVVHADVLARFRLGTRASNVHAVVETGRGLGHAVGK